MEIGEGRNTCIVVRTQMNGSEMNGVGVRPRVGRPDNASHASQSNEIEQDLNNNGSRAWNIDHCAGDGGT